LICLILKMIIETHEAYNDTYDYRSFGMDAVGHWVYKVSAKWHPFQVWSKPMPRIDDLLIKTVFYVYKSEEDAREGSENSATGFFFCIPFVGNQNYAHAYAVTNRHVIDQIENPVLRLNLKCGGFDVLKTKKSDWITHPHGYDVAVVPIGGIGIDTYDISYFFPDNLVTPDFFEKMAVGVGDEVIMIGNFQRRGGKKKNFPVTRFGNISQMAGEPMTNPHTGLPEESILVEMRSISGYSGSPVILYIPAGSWRGQAERKTRFSTGQSHTKLLGINWGHIQEKEKLKDENGKDHPDRLTIWINSAMAGVVPIWKLSEILYDEELVDMRKEAEEEIQREIDASGPIT
jgi:hypothetical protein